MVNVWYSALFWKAGVWYVTVYGVELREALAALEKKNFGSYCFEAGCVQVGVDNCDVPLRRALNNLKK